MAIPSRVRYFAKQAYQLNLMRGFAVSNLGGYTCRVHCPAGSVHVLDRETNDQWLVPIAKAWAQF